VTVQEGSANFGEVAKASATGREGKRASLARRLLPALPLSHAAAAPLEESFRDAVSGWHQRPMPREGTASCLEPRGSPVRLQIPIRSLFAGKRGILFAVPGAFTPTCSKSHLPSYIEQSAALKAAGLDVIACLATNDAWTMQAWGEQQGATGKVRMLSDVSGDLSMGACCSSARRAQTPHAPFLLRRSAGDEQAAQRHGDAQQALLDDCRGQ